MRKWLPPYIILMPILLVFILYYVLLRLDPKFHNYIYNTQNKEQEQENQEQEPELRKKLEAFFSELSFVLPDETRQKIAEAPLAFLQDVLLVYKQSSPEEILLVDKQHPLAQNYVPENLVALDNYRDSLVLNKKNMQLSKAALEALLLLSRAAAEEGITLDISSAYRDFSYQKQLFAYYTETLGLEEASRQSALPGTSQHQLGTAVDFGSISPEFGHSKAGQWLLRNAWKYGFSLSYPEGMEEITGYVYESWHYRYIGLTACSFEQQYFQGRGQQQMLEILARKEELYALAEQVASLR